MGQDVDHRGGLLYRTFDLEDFEGSRPVYVASVAFGRLAFITLETAESKETIAAGISAILETPALAVDASAGRSVKAVQNARNLAITVIGSDQVVTTLAGFRGLLETGGFSSANAGQIVAYELRFVDDDTIASTVYAGEYTLRSVTRMGHLVLEHRADTYTLWQRPRSDLGIYPDDATGFTDLGGETAPVRLAAATLGDALRLRTLDVHDYNAQDKSVPYGPGDEAFTLERALADGGYMVVVANRADGQVNRYVKLRVKVAASPAN